MKKIATISFIVAVVVGALLFSTNLADAEAPPLPTHMEKIDLLELENIQLKLEVLERQVLPLYARRGAIFARYKIDMNDLNKTVTINESGDIVRKPIARK